MKSIIYIIAFGLGSVLVFSQNKVSASDLEKMLNEGLSSPTQLQKNNIRNTNVQLGNENSSPEKLSASQVEALLNGKSVQVRTKRSVKQPTQSQKLVTRTVVKKTQIQLPECTRRQEGKTIFSSTGAVYQCLNSSWSKS